LEGVDCFPAQRRAVLEGNAEYRQVVKSGSVGIHEAESYHTLRHRQARDGDRGLLNSELRLRVVLRPAPSNSTSAPAPRGPIYVSRPCGCPVGVDCVEKVGRRGRPNFFRVMEAFSELGREGSHGPAATRRTSLQIEL